MITNKLGLFRTRHGSRGISQAHLARQIGVDRSYVNKVEKGKLQPSARVMFRIAQYFGVHVDEIFQYKEEKW